MGVGQHSSDRQVAAIPLRWRNGRVEVLLVTTRGTGRWTIPKGWTNGTGAASRCAAREAFEEAGVRGAIAPQAIGAFTYWKRAKEGRVPLRVSVFELYADALLSDWPERRERKRAWVTDAEARALVQNDELAQLIATASTTFAALYGGKRVAMR